MLIQSVCPGRKVTHIGTALDSVTFALFKDAITHKGPARRSRIPGSVCAQPSRPGWTPPPRPRCSAGADSLTGGRSTASRA